MTTITTNVNIVLDDYEVEVDVDLADVLAEESVEDVLDEMNPDAEELLDWVFHNDRIAIARYVLESNDVRTDIINALLEQPTPDERLEWMIALDGDSKPIPENLPVVTFTPVEGLLDTVWRVQADGKNVGITIEASNDHQVEIWGADSELIKCKSRATARLIAEALVTNSVLRSR